MQEWKKYKVGKYVVFKIETEYGTHTNIWLADRPIGSVMRVGANTGVTVFLGPRHVMLECASLKEAWNLIKANSSRRV